MPNPLKKYSSGSLLLAFLFAAEVLTLILGLHLVLREPIAPVMASAEIRNAVQSSDLKSAINLTRQLNVALEQYLKTPAGVSKNQRQAVLKGIAMRRKKLMMKLAAQDPAGFLAASLPASARKKLPNELLKDVEMDVSLTGDWKRILRDDFKGKRSEFMYYIKSEKGIYQLSSPKSFPIIPVGSSVRTRGLIIGNRFVIPRDAYYQILDSSQFRFPSTTKGDRHTLVMLVNLAGNTARPFTQDEVQDFFFGVRFATVNNYYQEASFNQTSFSGDVVDWYTSGVAFSREACDETDELEAIMSEAMQNASNQSMDLRAYKHFVLYIPDCASFGFSDIGPSEMETPDGTIVGTKTWLMWPASGSNRNTIYQLAVHELGHALGLNHAASEGYSSRVINGYAEFDGYESYEVVGMETGSPDWYSVIYQLLVVPRNGGSVNEYGDPYDTMGTEGSNRAFHFNAPHKQDLDWLTPSQVKTVTRSGEYTIEPVEVPGDGIKLLRVPRSYDRFGHATEWYLLEYRQPVGYDEYFDYAWSRSNVTNGVLVHHEISEFDEYTGTYLLNMNPSDATWRSAALEVGNRYSDPVVGVSFMPIATSSRGVTVDITVVTPSTTSAF